MRTTNDRGLLGVCTLVFAATATATVLWCTSMATSGMLMPGGWTMSMTWMRMPGETWLSTAASFLSMWMVMMVAMMLPSLAPMLRRYREAIVDTAGPRVGRLTAMVAAGYYAVWVIVGTATFPLGVTIAEAEMLEPALAPAVPAAVGLIAIIVGWLQFSPWKMHHLACCRATSPPHAPLPDDVGTAWRHGVRLGLHCAQCCGGLIVLLLVLGVMDLRVMLAVGAAISIERLAPSGEQVARGVGAVVVCVGLALIGQALGDRILR